MGVGPGLQVALKVSTETVVYRDLLSSSVRRGAVNLVGIIYTVGIAVRSATHTTVLLRRKHTP